MSFSQSEVEKLLAQCHRRCCVCHKYCGSKMEVDHINPRSVSKDDTIENAIPVCFECHAEIHLYNPEHPRGRRFTPTELRYHREQWLKICDSRPEILIDPVRSPNPGSIEKIWHELEYNGMVAGLERVDMLGCQFETTQLSSAIADGTFSMLSPEVRQALQDCHIRMRRANYLLMMRISDLAYTSTENKRQLTTAIGEAKSSISKNT